MDLADLNDGKHETRAGKGAEHDIDDKRKLISKWWSGKVTPDLATCLSLLDGLEWGGSTAVWCPGYGLHGFFRKSISNIES